jgi:spore maturation protein CgeB
VEIIESPDERARRAQNAHQRVCDSFTVQPQVAKIEAILRQVAQARR